MSLPETNGPMRAWLRLNVIDNVKFSPPRQDAPELPMLIVYRVGGLPDNHGADWPDFIVECWDVDLAKAERLATMVANAVIDGSERAPVVVEGVLVEPSTCNGYQPSSGVVGAKRYRVDVSMRMRKA